jgi:transcriptional regulator with XRE-family HTH domain
VLRSTRKLYGFSREKLASRVGVAPITIKQIETGKLKPSALLAYQIYMQTGLNPDQLIKNSSPETPRHPGGEPLTGDYMERIREIRRQSVSQEEVDMSVQHFAAVLESLFDSSLPEQKFWALLPALQADIDRRIDSFGLRKALQKLVKARWGIDELWSIHDPDLSLYVKANTPTREKATAVRTEFFRDRDSIQKILKGPLPQKTPRSTTRKRSVA